MSGLSRFLSKILLFWTWFNFGWLMVISLPFVILPIMISEKQGGRLAYWVMRIWGIGFCNLSGIFFKVNGLENLQKDTSYIFTANHGSFLDSPALVAAIPEQFKALGKKEILSYPIFGLVFRYIGVTVDRNDPASRRNSLFEIRKKLEKGIHIVFFPEGSMNKTPELLGKFYDGAFWLAIETQTQIIPMAIKNSRNLCPHDFSYLRPGRITIEIGKPIDSKGLTLGDLSVLKDQTRVAIKQMLEA